MIKTIRLTNFQSHIETALQLGPGLNVITGPSDSGKTAVIRALRWALYNEPRGDAFVRAGENSCEVAVTFAGGATVIRSRKGRTNEYRVNGGSGELRFEAFGADPPPDVAQASEMPKIAIGDREIPANFAYQLDGPFLLSESPLTAAKVLGKLAGTEEVDHAGRLVSVDLYRRRQEERRLTADVAALTEELHRYDGLPALKAILERLTEIIAAVRAAETRLAALTRLRAALIDLSARQTALAARIVFLQPASDVGNALGSLQSDSVRLLQLWTRAGLLAENAAQATDATATLLTATTVLFAEPAVLAATAHRERLTTFCRAAGNLAIAGTTIRTTRAQLTVLARIESAADPTGIAFAAAERLRALRPYPGVLAGNAATRAAALTLRSRAMGIVIAESPTQDATLASSRLAALRRLQTLQSAAESDRAVIADRLDRANCILTAEAPLARALAIRVDWVSLSDYRIRLSQLLVDSHEATGQAAVADRAVATHEQTYIDILVASGTCPVCGSFVDPIRLREVLSA